MRKFHEIEVGEVAEITHKITQSDIDSFVKLTGDDNKIHVDREFAKETSFKRPVVHGMLGASFISTVIGTKLPGDGAVWYSQNLEFLRPVRINDIITVRAEVLKKFENNKTLELSTKISNQSGQKVVDGTAKVQLVESKRKENEKAEKYPQKVAVVFGATGGIGFATSLQLAEDGFDIVIHYHHNKEKAEHLRTKILGLGRKSVIVKADIIDIDAVREAITETTRKFGSILAVVNSTTINVPDIKFQELNWDTVEKHFDLSVKGAFNIVKCVVPIMKENKYGKIIHLTTQYIETVSPDLIHYITAKSALSGFTKALAFDLAPMGIRVNMVSPGMTDTDLIADIPEKSRLLAAAKTPLRRIATPEDIAGAVSFLVSNKSDFLVGETIRVNGGQVTF